ncbi:MAG: nitrogenase component 1 [Clostridium sp.]|uniref:nitrogenase component 1 n=1 Tax=Clostridium sp. TaxID=1506 RepID=UPI0039EA1179
MKNRNFVNVNVNPCKMCMPIGAIIAFKGIEDSMMILHGSQGCSAYMRTYMTGHFNEQIDVASSSLNEHGAVYGGSDNLKKALKNVIKVYNPKIVGVGTTCLAETIGEDVERITEEFIQEEEVKNIKIIPMSTPGYGGTQFEGYFTAIKSVLEQLAKKANPNNKINVIASHMSPGDVRNIKDILDMFDIDYILLPDISKTLDAPFSNEYSRIQKGGTKLKDIEIMPGARATIEISAMISDELSPGKYLLDKYNVPLYRCPIPIGRENTDEFIKILSRISNKPIPQRLLEDRGRLIDGMIDSHKYNAEGRAVIYGEPDLVYSVSKLCLENGIKPMLICTGAENVKLKDMLSEEIENLEEKPVIIDDTDFQTIQQYAKELNVNILIGSSNGKFLTEKDGIPPVRIGFPIHDRMGGQRLVYTGYNGSLKLLDDITNTFLQKKFTTFRSNLYEKYYEDAEKQNEMRF